MISRLTRFVQSDYLLHVALALLAYSLILVFILASECGVHLLTFKTDGIQKSVGYSSAPNWWPVYSLIIPAILASLVWLNKSVTQVIHNLNDAHMWFDYKRRACFISVTSVHQTWTRCLAKSLKVWLFVLVPFVLLYSVHECWDESISPILSRKMPQEVDWSVAALFSDAVTPTRNIIFSIAAWAMQFVGVSLVLLLPCITGAFVPFFRAHSNPQGATPCLKPDITDSDRRKGFQRLEEIGLVILSAGLLAYLGIYFVILQNVYLRHPAPSLSQLLDITHPISYFLFPDRSTIIAVILAFGLIVGVIIIVPCVMLSRSATLARDNWRNYLKGVGANGSELCDMQIWPYRYLRLNVLIGCLLLGIFGLIVPSIGTWLFVTTIMVLVGWAASIARNTFRVRDSALQGGATGPGGSQS